MKFFKYNPKIQTPGTFYFVCVFVKLTSSSFAEKAEHIEIDSDRYKCD